MPDTDPLSAFTSTPPPVREAPIDKIRRIARSDNLSDDIADDFSGVTGLESGRSHYGRGGRVKVSPVDPKDGQRAIGFSQIKASTAKSVGIDNPYDEESNIKAGLRYYAQGGDDPIRRRIAYFSGQNSGAVRYYDRTGRIPGGGDFTGTSFKQYVAGTGGDQQVAQDPLTTFTQGKSQPATDPLSVFTQPEVRTPEQPQGRGAAMTNVASTPQRPTRGAQSKSYDTSLTSQEESQFQQWKQQYAPNDSSADYDLRGAFKAGLTPDPKTGHWPDTFKKPNHPTFSNESMYAVGADAAKAGHWEGDKFIPPAQPQPLTSNDAAWHFGMTPEEAKKLTPKALRVLTDAVTEDQRKKAGGETIAPPPLKYQNDMRRQAGLQPLKFNIATDASKPSPYYQPTSTPFSLNEKKPIEVRRPFTFNQPSDDQIKAGIQSQVASEAAQAQNAAPSRLQGGGVAPPSIDVHAETEKRFNDFKAERAKTLDYARLGPRVGARNDPNERAGAAISDLLQKYAPGIASIDTPGGLKTDVLRGVASGLNVVPGPQAALLNQISQPRGITPEEKILDPNAEANAGMARTLGQTSTAFLPFIGAGKLVSAAGVASPVLRDLLTFGLAEAGKQLSQTGKIDPESLAETMVTGGVMGKIAGVDPSLKRRLVAYIAPQLAAGVVKGEKPDQILQGATQNALFALAGGHDAKEQAPTQTVPDALQAKLRGGEIDTALAQREAAVKPSLQPEQVPAMRVVDSTQGAQPIELNPAKYPETKYPESLGLVGPTKPVETGVEGAKLNRWQHRDFGLVTESVDQAGVGKDKVRVLAEDGTEHVIQRPKGTGAGNQIAVPVRAKPVDARAQDEAAQAAENAPFKVIDRRGQNEQRPDIRVSTEQPSGVGVRLSQERVDSGNREGERQDSSSQSLLSAEESASQDRATSTTRQTTKPIAPEQPNTVVPEVPATEQSTPLSASEPSVTTPTAIPEAKTSERSFPKTLEATGRKSGTDRTYQIVGDQEAIDKADARINESPEAARQWASDQLDKGSGKEAIATGLRVADNLSAEATKESDPAKAAEKHAQASELYSKLSARLTESGQEIQAASLAQRYSPVGAALEVQRIVEKVKGEKAKPELRDTKTARDLAEKYQTADARIGELEKQIAQLQAGKPVRLPRVTSLTPLKAKLDKAAEDAALRIAKTKAKMEAGQLEFRNAGPLPGHIATHLTDYAIIGAAKIAKGGLTFAEWSAEMIKDLGEDIKPHLATIFRASKKHLDEQRSTVKEESAQRGAAKELTKQGIAATPENIESLRAEKSKLQAERRQARVDLDRHYRELERKEQGHKLDAGLSLTRDSLLSARGVLRIAIGMGGKQVMDFSSRFVKAGTDIARSTVTGGPRTVSAPSFSSTLRTIGGFVERAPSAIKSATQGKPSEVMPNAHGGPTENPYVNLTVGVMQRIYAGKEAFISSWAYPEALENNARVFALNDRADGIIKFGETNQRTRDYLSGKLSFEGKRNQRLAQSLANQAADYEVRNKQIVPSMKEFRAKEMADSPSELLHSMALQATDRAVYRQPYESKLAQKLGQVGTDSVGGKIARNIVLPFSKRPANNIADNLFGYTGVRIFGEGYKAVRESINGEFGPARVKSFNDAIGKGATGFAVMAVGAVLAKQGKLISPLDKDKSRAGSLFINGKYYNISNVPVIGWLLGMGAAYQKDGAANLPKALYRMISEHPLLRSAKDISDMVEGLKSNKLGEQLSEYAGRQASRLIPAPVKIAAEASDTEERQTKFSGKKTDVKENLIAPTEASLPILRRRLPSTGTKATLSIVNPLYSKPISRRSQGRVIQ